MQSTSLKGQKSACYRVSWKPLEASTGMRAGMKAISIIKELLHTPNQHPAGLIVSGGRSGVGIIYYTCRHTGLQRHGHTDHVTCSTHTHTNSHIKTRSHTNRLWGDKTPPLCSHFNISPTVTLYSSSNANRRFLVPFGSLHASHLKQDALASCF